MTQKTTLPGNFTGPLVATLPKFIHSAPVTSGLVRRYAAATLDTTQIGGPVASLADLTGNGAALRQSDVALQPTARQTGVIRYLEFTNDSMRADASGGKTFAVVGRFRANPTAGYSPIAALGEVGGGTLSIDGNGQVLSYGTSTIGTSITPGTGWHVFIATFAAADSLVQVDSQTVTGNAGTPASQMTSLGLNTNDQPTSLIDVAEMLIWNRPLSVVERSKVVAELRANYGI